MKTDNSELLNALNVDEQQPSRPTVAGERPSLESSHASPPYHAYQAPTSGAPISRASSSRAMRVSLARAFPVRIAPMREALVSGSITKLARP